MTMESRIPISVRGGSGVRSIPEDNRGIRELHMAPKTMDTAAFSAAFDAIVDNIETVIKGKTDVVRLALVAILCEGHILFEDVPGTGKSMLARAIAQSLNATSNRVQCTPDMLPGDITGSSILDPVIDTLVVRAMIDYATQVEISPEVGYYIVDLVHASRKDPSVAMGGSPRASIALLRASRCLAASDGREHVYPDDVRAVLRAVMAHRLVLNPDAMLRGDTVDAVLERMTAAVKPPLSARRSKQEA